MSSRWLEVPITQATIDAATPSDCYNCLIARALRQATGFSWHVTDDSARIETYYTLPPGMRRTWHFPQAVCDLIWRFDHREKIEPTSFKLPARFADKKWLDYGAGVHCLPA